MKKVVMLAIMGMLAMVMSAGTASAVDCDKMQIQSTGTTAYTASGLFVKVVPTVANACGAVGTPKTYYLATENTDATYATILTALSLGKTLFIQVSAATSGSLLTVVSVKQ